MRSINLLLCVTPTSRATEHVSFVVDALTLSLPTALHCPTQLKSAVLTLFNVDFIRFIHPRDREAKEEGERHRGATSENRQVLASQSARGCFGARCSMRESELFLRRSPLLRRSAFRSCPTFARTLRSNLLPLSLAYLLACLSSLSLCVCSVWFYYSHHGDRGSFRW